MKVHTESEVRDGALETGQMDEWIEYFCAVAHERARAISQSQLADA